MTRQKAKTRVSAVAMKISGVVWLGDIPAHWHVKRFKYLARIRAGHIDPTLDEFSQRTLVAPNYIQSGTGKLFETSTAKEQGADNCGFRSSRGR